MKDKIYSEIERLENSNSDFNKHKGHIVRLAADTIHCFKCIDTKRCWHDRYHLPWAAMDGKGNFDIDGCPECNNIGWISCSHSNYNEENGVSIYHKDDNNCWDLRFEQLYKKGLIIEQKINTLKEPEVVISKPEEKALFEVNKRITRQHIEKTLEVDIEVGKIVDIVKNSVEAYFGNIFSLVDLCKELKVSFTISESESSTTDKLIKIKDNNYLGIKTSVKTSQNKIKTGLFEKNKYAKEYTADIFILKPLNEEAIEKSKLIMSKISDDMINDILKEF
jgi:hypothetical protein